MNEASPNTIHYYVWLLSDWAYLGGVRFIQMAARHNMASTIFQCACPMSTPPAAVSC